MTEIEKTSRSVVELYITGDLVPAQKNFILLEQKIMSNPFQLNEIEDFGLVGKALICMLHSNIFKHEEKILSMANISYLCLSKSLQNDNKKIDSYMDRANLLGGGKALFQNEIITAFGLLHGLFVLPFQLSNEKMNNMEVADLDTINNLYLKYQNYYEEGLHSQYQIYEQKRQELERQFSNKEKYSRAINAGIETHAHYLTYLEDKVLKQGIAVFRPQFS